MNFGQALKILKNGGKVARKGWNGKGMYLFIIKSYSWDFEFVTTEWETVKSDFIAMKTADGYIVPWLASQTDMLAEDWEELK